MMQLHKGFICVGKCQRFTKNRFMLCLGILGACITLFGTMFPPSQLYYVAGSALLLTMALYFKLLFFVALEIILMCGHGAVWLGLGEYLQVALPILLCVQLLIFYWLSGQASDGLILFGILGIAILSTGFSYHNHWIFFIGSAIIAVYAFYHSKKMRVALVWAFLNTIFAIMAFVKLCTPWVIA